MIFNILLLLRAMSTVKMLKGRWTVKARTYISLSIVQLLWFLKNQCLFEVLYAIDKMLSWKLIEPFFSNKLVWIVMINHERGKIVRILISNLEAFKFPDNHLDKKYKLSLLSSADFRGEIPKEKADTCLAIFSSAFCLVLSCIFIFFLRLEFRINLGS